MSTFDLRPARRDAPTVRLMSHSSGPFVRKSYRHCPLFLRETVGRFAVQRECWALARLGETGHAPALLGQPDRFTVEMEYVEGTPLEKLQPGEFDPEKLLREAHSLLAALNKAGLAHGDLGHDHWQSMGRESNLIWSSEERLVAIDFAGSVPLHPPTAFFRRLARALQHHDRLIITKLAYHLVPQKLSPSEAAQWPLGLWDLLRLLGKI